MTISDPPGYELEEALAEIDHEHDRSGYYSVRSVPIGFYVAGLDLGFPKHHLILGGREDGVMGGVVTLIARNGIRRDYASTDRVLAIAPEDIPDPEHHEPIDPREYL